VILQGITRHLSTRDWSAVAIEFLIVVVGIFVGREVSNWNA
jgi:hypothetical protein